jgi:hypothetical protein
VGAKAKMSSIGQPVPELPVTDVERAQQHYRNALGFEIGRLYPGKEIGAVSRGNVAIFFRKRKPPFTLPFTGYLPKISMHRTRNYSR